MLIHTKKGLYCEAGDFYIDPMGACDRAVVTHAHSDHARRGAKQYYTAASGLELLRVRLGKKIVAEGIPYGQPFWIGGVKLSFHPAGHILGSAQVRLEYRGEVWVASGDYKREPDPTAEPFEVVACDVFVTEATFGTPGFAWPKDRDLGREIFDWWQENANRGANSVLFAYSLGKAQRVLGVLEPYTTKAVHCHAASQELTACYREQGVRLAPTICIDDVPSGKILEGALVLVPQAFLSGERAAVLGDDFETAFASGWMMNGGNRYGRESGFDRGFVMSDHADWNDLVRTILETGAKRVYVQHRGNGALVKHLRKLGLQAFPESDLERVAGEQMALL